jgi:hypothetical protein
MESSRSRFGTSAITEPFHGIIHLSLKFLKHTNWWRTPFINYRKSTYTGSASLKSLPLMLGPLCKEKSTVLFIKR